MMHGWIPKASSYIAEQLLSTYVQTGALRPDYEADCVLAASGLQIGNYRIRNLRRLALLGFLLGERTRRFVRVVLENLETLRAQTFRQHAVLSGMVRGAVNWSRTIPLQVVSPTSYACTDPRRSFELPENLMLVALVEGLRNAAADIRSYWPVSPPPAELDWRYRLDHTLNGLDRIRENAYYQQIPKPAGDQPRLPCRATNRVRVRRSRLSRTVLDHYLGYEGILGRGNRQALHAALGEGLRWPSEDKIFELFVLFALTDRLKTRCADRPRINPIHYAGQRERWFAKLSGSAERAVTLYYQTGPRDLRISYTNFTEDRSIRDYRRVLLDRGKTVSALRPDVVIDCTCGQQRRLVLVEVKNSKAADTVLRGLRELTDYKNLVRERRTDTVLDAQVIGLLCVGDLEGTGLSSGVNESFADCGYGLVTAAELIQAVTGGQSAAEMDALTQFCWFG